MFDLDLQEKIALLNDLRLNRDSMTEFDEVQMDYLISLVEADMQEDIEI